MKKANWLKNVTVITGSIFAIIVLWSLWGSDEESWDFFKDKGGTSFTEISQTTPPEQINSLFTSHLIMPILDINPENYVQEKTKIKGICKKTYEIGIGYEEMLSLFEQYKEAVCNDEINKLPEPKIISSFAINSEILGKYNQVDCDNFDKVNLSGKKTSHYLIMEEIKKSGSWNSIVENSRKTLGVYFGIFCDDSTKRRSK